MRDEASNWLAGRGIDQWRKPWPDHDAMADRIAASIDAKQTWMVHDDSEVVATCTERLSARAASTASGSSYCGRKPDPNPPPT